jgi:hypothetical protein
MENHSTTIGTSGPDLPTLYRQAVERYDKRKPWCIAQLHYIGDEEEGYDPTAYKLVLWRRYETQRAARNEPDLRQEYLGDGWAGGLYVLKVSEFERHELDFQDSVFGTPVVRT